MAPTSIGGRPPRRYLGPPCAVNPPPDRPPALLLPAVGPSSSEARYLKPPGHGTIRSMDDGIARAQLAEKLRISLEMSSEGFEMKRMQLRRRFPEADDAEIDRRFRSWLQE